MHARRACSAPSAGSPACSAVRGVPPGRRTRRGARPRADGRPDPGEVVWAWVPYDENDGRGKDRPVLVIGRRGDRLLGLMLSSQDHDKDAEDEARHGRLWTDIGSGAWDGAAGRARSGWIGCWCSTRPPSAGRARRSTGCASTGSSARPDGSRAGERSVRRVAGGLAGRRPQVVDADPVDQRLEVVAVHDLGPVVQVDVGDGRQRLTVSRRPDLDPAVERPPMNSSTASSVLACVPAAVLSDSVLPPCWSPGPQG